jgi:hypothetical protein
LNILEFNNFLEKEIKRHINESMDREDMLKIFKFARKSIFKIMLISNKVYFETLINEIYTCLRKIQNAIVDFTKESIFFDSKKKKSLKECCLRNELYLREVVSSIQVGNEELISQIEKELPVKKFLLKLDYQKNIPNSVEYLFTNLIQYKDEVYYIKTNDLISHFYFYRNSEGKWFWSPPRKTDNEDIWMETPKTKIEKGHWIDQTVPAYIAEFIIWLDIFKPNIPEFYFDKKEQVKTTGSPGMDKLIKDFEKLDKKLKNDQCFIY